MNKKKIKLIIILIPLIVMITALSGCIAANAIQTKHWDHTNSEGTAVRLWGYLKLPENAHNWDAYFVYDTEKHDNWELYKYRKEADSYNDWNYFSLEIDSLNRTTEYHYRAIGEHKSQANTIRVGADLTFIPGGPRVIVKNPSFIGLDSAVIEGELNHMGGDDSCEVHFSYGTDPDNLNLETPIEVMTSTGNFNAEITGLSSCQKYYYKTVAINDADTWVSNAPLNTIREFIPGMPVTQTYLPHEVTTNSAKYRGELFGFGGTSTSEVWFEYGDDNPNNLDEVTDSITLDTLGEYSIVQANLTEAKTYWVRAVANNGICESKGEVKEFRTLGYKNQIIQPIESSKEQKYIKENSQVSILKTRLTDLINRLSNRFEYLNNIIYQRFIEKYPLIEKYLEDFILQ